MKYSNPYNSSGLLQLQSGGSKLCFCSYDLGDKYVSWTKELNIGRIKELKGELGTTFNDVVMALITSSLRNVLNNKGEYCPKKFSASIPLNTRLHADEASEFSNKFSALILWLPTQVRKISH